MTDIGESVSVDIPASSSSQGSLKVKVLNECDDKGVKDVEVIVLEGGKKTKKNTDDSGIADFGQMDAGNYIVKIKKHFEDADYFLILLHYPRITWSKKAIVEAMGSASVAEGGDETVEFKIKVFRLISPIVFKRKQIAPFEDDKYGHWWTELGGGESYGWWPSKGVGLVETFTGVPGALNGVVDGRPVFGGGSETSDPHDGDVCDMKFSPVINDCRTDEELKDIVRSVATSYSGEWSWILEFGNHCHTFQKKIISRIEAKGFKDV